jgi:hypothetical protein
MRLDSDVGVIRGRRSRNTPALFFATSFAAVLNLTEVTAMYGSGSVAPVVATTATLGALTLPNTGGNLVVTLAVSVATGLVAWGVLYARAAR